uniref:Uncharacterized protein n=1 Tax=Timema shepardi TaxID=629360 RepID=A0A7R9B9D8_TIMSH|nr:unnamed protein product [Timema shepardi]
MSLNDFPEEDEASRRSKSLDGETTIIARHFSEKESMGKMNKTHKTPWGKVKDIIQTRKDSLKRKQRGGKGVGSDPEEDAVPESEDEQYDATNQLGSHWVYDPSTVWAVSNYGMADSIVAASIVLPNTAVNSLPGPSQGRNIDKRRKRVRLSSPLIEKTQGVVTPQPHLLVMSRVENNEDLKSSSPFILE